MTTISPFRLSVLDALARQLDDAQALATVLTRQVDGAAAETVGRLILCLGYAERSLSMERMTVEHELGRRT